MQYDLRKKLFNHLQELSFSYFSKTPVGWIMSRVTSDSERIAQLVTWGMLDVTWAFFSIGASMYFMFRLNWRLALVVLAIVPILIVVAIYFKTKILVQFRAGAQAELEDHGRVQPEHHRRAGGQGAGPRGCEPARVRGPDRRDVPVILPGCVAVRAVPADRADHQRVRGGRDRALHRPGRQHARAA